MNYNTAITKVLEHSCVAPLGPANKTILPQQISSISVESLYEQGAVVNKSYAECVLAGILLRLNDLRASHDYSNEIASPDGSYWHALMHRREPDISNSNYWFRRVGNHPIFKHLSDKVRQLGGGEYNGIINRLTHSGLWSPQSFNDLCEENRDSDNDLEIFCIKIQEEEWRLLFNYCYVNSIGKNWQATL